MDTTRLLSNHRVADLPRAEAWYSALFGRGPDARPMDGLLEWHLGDAAGVQVWLEPEAAGRLATTSWRTSSWSGRAPRSSRCGWPGRSIITTMSSSNCWAGS